MGKTVITLSTISELCDRATITKTLIFGTKRIIYEVWENEAAKWDHTKHLTFVNLHKTGVREGLLLDAHVYLLNYENIGKLVDILGDYRMLCKTRFPFHLVVYDEVTKMKNAKSKRFKTWKKALRFVERRIGLTATPAPNGLGDLFGQAFCIDGGISLGKFSTHFRDRFFYQADYFGYKWELKEGAEEKIYKALSEIVIRMDADDYLDLPELVFNPVYVTLPAKVMKDYRELEKEFLLELEDGEEIVASTAASLQSKLHQFTQGAVYTDPEDKSKFSIIHNEKIEALKDIAEELQGAPALCSYWFAHDMKRLRGPQGAFKGAPYIGGGVKDADASKHVSDWLKGRLELLFVQPVTVAHGLNLQGGGSNIILFSMDWNLETYLQLIGRLRRQGQEADRVFVHGILARDTVDEVIWQRIQEKDTTQKGLLKALKEYQKRKYG